MGKKILLVDDDKELCATLTRVLTANGHAVTTAHSGAAARMKVVSVRPDLIILDIIMETDTAGFELINMLRSDRPNAKYREFKDVPIVVLSAIDRVTHSRFSLDDGESFLPGAVDFITKPVTPEQLLAKVDAH